MEILRCKDKEEFVWTRHTAEAHYLRVHLVKGN